MTVHKKFAWGLFDMRYAAGRRGAGAGVVAWDAAIFCQGEEGKRTMGTGPILHHLLV